MSLETYRSILKEFGEGRGIKDLSPDEDGVCRLKFGSLEVAIKADKNTENLMIFAIVGQIEPRTGAGKLKKLLQANLFWHETAGATFSLDEESRSVVLARQGQLQFLDANLFDQWLSDFSTVAQTWTENLLQPIEEPARTASRERGSASTNWDSV